MRSYDNTKRRGIYRSRNGVILGVCRGIAQYFDLSVFWVRIIALAILIFTCFWPGIGIYFLAALIMKPEPVIPIQKKKEKEFYDSYTQSPHGASQRLRRKFENLKRRIQRLEDIVTSPEFEWEDRFRS